MECADRCRWPAVRRRPGGDAGLTLVEVLVTMSVLTIGLLCLLPTLIGASRTVGLANERQQATAMAQGVLEQVRAAATTPARRDAIARGGPTYPAPGWSVPAGESLLTAASPDPALRQVDSTVGGATFTVRTFVTSRAADPAGIVWVTAVSSWSSGNARGAGPGVVLRTAVHLGTGA